MLADDIASRRRNELLEAAFSLIAEKGLEGLRTRDVAQRAGVNISTLFYYFGSKDALVAALVGHIRDIFTAASGSGSPAYTDLRSHLANAWARFQSNPGLATALQELMLRSSRDEVIRSALDRVLQHWSETVAGLVRQDANNGQLETNLDPVRTAALVTSFVIGATLRLNVNPTAFSFGDVSDELQNLLKAAS